MRLRKYWWYGFEFFGRTYQALVLNSLLFIAMLISTLVLGYAAVTYSEGLGEPSGVLIFVAWLATVLWLNGLGLMLWPAILLDSAPGLGLRVARERWWQLWLLAICLMITWIVISLLLAGADVMYFIYNIALLPQAMMNFASGRMANEAPLPLAASSSLTSSILTLMVMLPVTAVMVLTGLAALVFYRSATQARRRFGGRR